MNKTEQKITNSRAGGSMNQVSTNPYTSQEIKDSDAIDGMTQHISEPKNTISFGKTSTVATGRIAVICLVIVIIIAIAFNFI